MKFSEFVEKILGVKLLDYQRIYMDALYLKCKELGTPEKFIYGRGCLKSNFRMMFACMMSIYEKELCKNEE